MVARDVSKERDQVGDLQQTLEGLRLVGELLLEAGSSLITFSCVDWERRKRSASFWAANVAVKFPTAFGLCPIIGRSWLTVDMNNLLTSSLGGAAETIWGRVVRARLFAATVWAMKVCTFWLSRIPLQMSIPLIGAYLTHASDPMTTCCRTASTTRRQRSKGESVIGK
jgi:hypothetical protein